MFAQHKLAQPALIRQWENRPAGLQDRIKNLRKNFTHTRQKIRAVKDGSDFLPGVRDGGRKIAVEIRLDRDG